MGLLAAFPILILASIFQVVIASRLHLLQGSVDLILLIVVSWALQERSQYSLLWALIGGIVISIFSAVSPLVIIGGYLMITIIARMLQKRIWQMPILVLLFLCLLGTIINHLLTILYLQITGTNIGLLESLRLVTIPSALLNLLLAFPVYTVIKDLSNFIYPAEVQA